MLIGFVSDEYYAAIPDALVEFRDASGKRSAARSTATGAVLAELPAGGYEVALACRGYGSKRSRVRVPLSAPHQFRLLSDRLLGYAWPKWCRAGESVQFRVHSVAPYKLTLWRYGLAKEFVKNVGWYDQHGPRGVMQTVPDGFFAETGVKWDAGFGTVHGQRVVAPERSGLYYFHAKAETGEFFSFPLVVAPAKPRAAVAVLASTNTWNAYNPFGGRSNYVLAARMIDEPVVNSKSDLPRYKLADYGEWTSADVFELLTFDRPEPYNHVPDGVECADPIEGRQACHLAPAEWRLLGWLEREGCSYDLYSEAQLHDGTLDLDAYKVVVLNTHPEYWSVEMYRKVKAWVFERGGRLMYLGGNGLNCAVEYLDHGTAMRCLNRWPAGHESRFHAACESEANLLGVVFSDAGAMTSAPYTVLDPDHWAFAGTGLRKGDLLGTKILHQRYGDGASGHETDKVTPSSPKNVQVLAKGLNPDEGGAHLVFFETPNGGAVFSAGSITYPTGLLCDEQLSRVTKNVLERFLR
jgi:N,N-dimethylformamidase